MCICVCTTSVCTASVCLGVCYVVKLLFIWRLHMLQINTPLEQSMNQIENPLMSSYDYITMTTKQLYHPLLLPFSCRPLVLFSLQGVFLRMTYYKMNMTFIYEGKFPVFLVTLNLRL